MQLRVKSPPPSEVAVTPTASELSANLAPVSGELRQRRITRALLAARAVYLRCKPIFSWRGNEFEFVRLVRALSQEYLVPRMDEKALDDLYASRSDPWRYYKEHEQLRLRTALAILTAATGGRRLEKVFEVGCGEGSFTELLAPCCESLLAVDIAAVALERARNKHSWPASIHFEKLNIISDPIPSQFDLVVVTDVLTMIRDRYALQNVCRKLVGAVRPGGYILAGDCREQQIFETTLIRRWLGRRLFRSARWTLPLLANQPGLQQVIKGETATHMFCLLQKTV